MGTASLEGPLAKLDRAWLHMRTLNREVGAFKRSKTHFYTSEVDSQTGETVVRIWITREPPSIRWGLLVGDITHNLRSALDHLIWQLILLSGNKPTRNNQFPIYRVEKDYWAIPENRSRNNRDRLLAGVAEDYRTPIDEVQPYAALDRGEDPATRYLAHLGWLSNIDKHQVVHAAFIGSNAAFTDWLKVSAEPGGGFTTVTYAVGLLENGAEVYRVRLSKPQAKVEMEGDVPLYIGLGDGRLAVGDLKRLVGIIDGYLWSFRPFFEGKSWGGFRPESRQRPVAERHC